jgi:hypothetical protein
MGNGVFFSLGQWEMAFFSRLMGNSVFLSANGKWRFCVPIVKVK